MEYSEKRLKELILKAFKFTKEFLNQHNLRYIACGGTVLGAVRHNGFIPWDDDIDIYMPREDYDKMFDYADEMKKSGYELISLNKKGYYLPYAKISSLTSTIWEIEHLPYVMGVFIDVFPLDYFNEDDIYITKLQYSQSDLFRKYYIPSISQYNISFLWKSLFNLKRSKIIEYIHSKYYAKKSSFFLNRFKDVEQNYSHGSGKKCVCVPQWEGKIFYAKWFEDVIEWPFEDTTVTIPRDYDDYLILLYGDYMTPPPIDKRVSQHFHYFVNLERRLTIAEIREIKKNAE